MFLQVSSFILEAVELRSTVAENVRRLRRRAGLSQEELAHLIGKSERWLIEIEAARTDIKLIDAIQIAENLGVGIDELRRSGDVRRRPATLRRLTPRQVARIADLGTQWGTWLGAIWFPWIVAGFGPYAPEDIESHFEMSESSYPPEVERVFVELQHDIRERATRGEEVPYDGEDYKLTRFHVSSRRGRLEAPRLVLHFTPTTYYRMLATDQRLDVPTTSGGRTFTLRERYAADVDLRVTPVPELATHWGVGLAVVTADGKLLISERGNTAVDPHVYFPAVAEGGTIAMDAAPNGAPDHFKIASRGVLEELGVPLAPNELIWLSFGANSYLCEYGLIGRVDSVYTYDQIERRRSLGAARDSWETRRLHAVEFNPRAVAEFCSNPERRFSAFALITVAHALMHEYGVDAVETTFEGARVQVSQHLLAWLTATDPPGSTVAS